MMMRACAVCGKEFDAGTRGAPKRLCSDPCRREYRSAYQRNREKKPPLDRPAVAACRICGQAFRPGSRGYLQFLCGSEECARAWGTAQNNARRKAKRHAGGRTQQCEYCGVLFLAVGTKERATCGSDECTQARTNARNRTPEARAKQRESERRRKYLNWHKRKKSQEPVSPERQAYIKAYKSRPEYKAYHRDYERKRREQAMLNELAGIIHRYRETEA